MEGLIIFIMSIVLFGTFINYLRKESWGKKKRLTNLERFKMKFTGKTRIRQKAKESLAESLMIDPEKDIKISSWEREGELIEKANIHLARLNRFGKSKMNGEMLFLSSKGSVYKFTDNGIKKYL